MKAALLVLVLITAMVFVVSCSDDPVSPPEHIPASFRILIGTSDGLMLRDFDSTLSQFPVSSRSVEVIGSRIFLPNWGNNRVDEYDTTGEFVRSFPFPAGLDHYEFAMLPDNRVALFSNALDSIYISDSLGTMLARIGIVDSPNENLQNLDGVVAGDKLIFSETGDNRLLSIDLTTYEAGIFRDFSDLEGWLGAVDYHDGYYYICQNTEVYRFTETGDPTLMADLDSINITGIAVNDDAAFVTVNFAGYVYRVDLATHAVEVLVSGLNRPEDIEFLE